MVLLLELLLDPLCLRKHQLNKVVCAELHLLVLLVLLFIRTMIHTDTCCFFCVPKPYLGVIVLYVLHPLQQATVVV